MIVIGAPIRNRAWILPRYLESIYNLDYPKREIILCFLINDSNDESEDLIRGIEKSEYNQVIVDRKDYNFELCDRDFGRDIIKFAHFAQIRNDWINLFKNIKNITHIFSVDSDILLPSNSLKKLLANDKDICSIIVNNSVVRRGYGKDITNLWKLINGRYENILQYPQNTVFEVDVTGAAYLIKREVLNSVKYKSHVFGEDFGFCIQAKKRGYKIFVDSSIIGDHILKKEG